MKQRDVLYDRGLQIISFGILTFILCLGCGGTAVVAQSPEEPDKPNILVFIADDAGWRDFGTYGNENIQTPNIDQLAEGGLQLDQAF